MQVDRGDARGRELLGQLLGGVLGAGEGERAALSCNEFAHDGRLVVAAHVEEVVRHRGDRRRSAVDAVRHGVVQVALDQLVDRVVERRGEEQSLAVPRGGVEEALHGGQEAEVGHVVGLVEHGDLDVAQAHVALADEVLEATRGRDDDVDPAPQRGDLRVLAHATEDGHGAQLERGRERRHGLGDLDGQLTGGDQDEGARGVRRATATGLREGGDHRQRERHRLAAAGAAAAEHVATRKGVGRVAAWIGNGISMPRSRRAAMTRGWMPRSAKGTGVWCEDKENSHQQ